MPKSRAENTGNEGAAAKRSRQTVVGWEEHSEDERKSHLQQLSAKLKELGLTHVTLKDGSALLAQAEHVGTLSEHHTLSIEGRYPPAHQDQYTEFVNFTKTLVTDAQDLALAGPCVGEPAPATKAYSAARKAEVPVTFGGQVVLLVFWAPTDLSAIRHLRKIAEEHKDWVGKARIVCVSLAEEDMQDADLSDMPLVTHLCNGEDAAMQWGASMEAMEYNLIDSSGVIAKRADSKDFNVSKDIALCIAGQKLNSDEKKLSEGQWGSFSNEARRALLLRLGQLVKDGGLNTLCLRSDSVLTFTSEGQQGSEEARLVVDGILLAKQEATMVQIANELHAAKVLDVDFEFTTMFKVLDDEGDDEGDDPHAPPVLPPICSECKTSLVGAKARFLCACCPAPYYVVCEACEGRRESSTHAPYHVFFVVPPAGWSEEAHFSVGDLTTWPVFPDALSAKEPDVFCDGCGQSLETGTRFDCVQCDDHDLCAKCWQNQKPDDPHSGHVWIKIHEPRGCRLTVDPDDGMEGMEGFDGDEGDFGEEDEEEQDPTDTRIQLQ